MTPGARAQAAVEILDAIAGQGAPADVVAGAHFKSRRYIGSKDRAAIAALVYSVLRRRAQLDWWIARVGGDERAPDSRLRVVGALALIERWPARQIEAEFDGSPFRPARLGTTERQVATALEGQALEHRAQPPWVRQNYPEWLHTTLDARFGADLPREMAALAEPAPLDLRVNPIKGTRDKALHDLRKAGLTLEPTALSPLGLRVAGRPPLAALAAFKEGLVEVQDEGSQLAALLADARPGMRVCDFCAGAGGKTLAMAATMANKGHIVACDVSGRRLEAAVRRLRRAGAFNVEPRVLTSERDPWVKRHRENFDRVFIDAPCTGTGTWRRNPDAKWVLTPGDIAELVEVQRRILDSAARLVRPGGRLIYATCSILPAENEEQAARFAETHRGFLPVPTSEIWAKTVGSPCPAADPHLKLSPARHGTDGFFIAVFEKARDDGGARRKR